MNKYKPKVFTAVKVNQIVGHQYHGTIEEAEATIIQEQLHLGECIYIVEIKKILKLKAVSMEEIKI